MKTAVSLPDELFLRADELAKRQGIPRSRLYAKALAAYLAAHRHEEITAKLNEVLAQETDGLDPALRKLQAEAIGPEHW